jgi:hypothetical protein
MKNQNQKVQATKTAATNTAAAPTTKNQVAPATQETPTGAIKVESKTTETKKPQNEVVLTKADYGMPGHTVSILEQLNALARKGDGRKLSNKLAGTDPLPKKRKQLVLSWSVNGTAHTASVWEGENIDLLIPATVPQAEAAPEATK